MKLTLASVGNPDFGQNPNQPLWGCEPNRVVEVNSFKEASEVARDWIHLNDLGGGNWSGGDIHDDDGNFIAYVSYNGRVWRVNENGEKFSGQEITW